MPERSLRKTLLLCLILLICGLALPVTAQELDHIVAIVNEDIIAKSELDNKTREMLAQFSQDQTQLPSMQILQRQILERMISKRLQLQAAKRLGITVDDTTVTKAISNIAKTNKITLLQLREALEADGISFSLFREQLREDILISRLKQKEVINRIMVTDQDIKNHLAQEIGTNRQRSAVQLQHILIATPEGASPEDVQKAKKNIETIHQQLLDGANFSDLAIQLSDGRQALEGGNLGWIEVSRIPSLFTNMVDEMEAGEISAPIRNASGYHIVKLVDVKGGSKLIINQTHARHILITTNEIVSDDEARQRLETLRERILNGDAFKTLARSHSDDKASALKGGDLGWTSPGNLVPEFEQRMNDLELNEISQPFQTQFGWHIVQPLQRRQHDNTEEVLKNKARQEIQNQKSEEAIEIWLRQLRDEAYVEVHLDKSDRP
jgi:peptidyl-prolyl cis-trans isomerase SurA